MSLHYHKKHWLFHATMWVSAICVLLAFGFVSWKFNEENKWLVNEVDRLTAESTSMKGQLKMCANKTGELQKSVEGIVEEKSKIDNLCQIEPNAGSCNQQSCLFRVPIEDSASLVGFISVKGYVVKIKKEGYGFEKDTTKEVECSALVVTAGPDFWMNEQRIGYSKDEMITVPLPTVSSAQQKIFNQSSKEKPISVDVVISQPLGHDGGPCLNTNWHIINVK